MRMTFDLFDELLNAEIFCFFHNCMRQSWYSEVNVYFLELVALIVHSRVSLFLFDLRLRFRLCLRLCLQVPQTLAHNSGWMVVHSQVSPFLSLCFATKQDIFSDLLSKQTRWCSLTILSVLDNWVFGFGWILGVFAASSDS